MVLCVNKVKKSYSRIGPTLRKISNINKVLEIMTIWGESKIPYLFSINVNKPKNMILRKFWVFLSWLR